jgi:hypothetical protein
MTMMMTMPRLTTIFAPQRFAALCALLLTGGALAGCTKTSAFSNSCQRTESLLCDTVLAGNPDAGVPLGLVGYSCTGTDRPDDNATVIQGVPQGQICADQGTLPDGTFGWCCSAPDQESLTTCAYDPAQTPSCPEGYAYTCQGADRPEVFNPSVTCGNGVREGNNINYCCHSMGRPVGCTESRGSCPGAAYVGLTGWVCPKGYRPRGEDYGANESRSDYYYFVCGVPTAAPNGRDNLYCCLIPKPVPPGSSCVYSPDAAATKDANGNPITPRLPNCGPNRFAFACYGQDTPDQDFAPRMSCTDPPVSGKSDEGYDAHLFCCDYVPSS